MAPLGVPTEIATEHTSAPATDRLDEHSGAGALLELLAELVVDAVDVSPNREATPVPEVR